jgi:murein DD-endopeptidase MepM/ murein hydrolase activator NlpD
MKARFAFLVFVSFLLLAGCSSTPTRDVPANGVHVVQKGEFISQIAQSYGLEWEELARLNGLKPPYVLHIGQRLRLTPGAVNPSSTANRNEDRAENGEADPGEPIGTIAWIWPTEGRVVSTFKTKDATRKGIDIAGAVGQKIFAAADGEVVYSGAGLAGYGKLIIIKHDARFLSAYAYNDKLLVSEGQKVKIGQVIAHMGLESVDKPRLHFEIRLDGQPIDPLRQLPRRKTL